jgi:hypothetical protein
MMIDKIEEKSQTAGSTSEITVPSALRPVPSEPLGKYKSVFFTADAHGA